jgi:hypothetical protein
VFSIRIGNPDPGRPKILPQKREKWKDFIFEEFSVRLAASPGAGTSSVMG